MSRVVVLYRDQGSPSQDEAERAAITARLGTPPLRSRLDVQRGDLVIGRFSVLPFYRELEADVLSLGGRLINSASQHEYIADLRNWYGDLASFTPKTWFRLEDIDQEGPYVLKGGTNSRKNDWRTHMFAMSREHASHVYSRLAADGLVGRQEICIRKYVQLVTYGEAIGGLPITEEYRFFVVRRTIIAVTFYWDAFREDVGLAVAPVAPQRAVELVGAVVEHVGDKAEAYTVDVGIQSDGITPVLIELNDLQQSGLSGASPERFYGCLAHVLGVEGSSCP